MTRKKYITKRELEARRIATMLAGAQVRTYRRHGTWPITISVEPGTDLADPDALVAIEYSPLHTTRRSVADIRRVFGRTDPLVRALVSLGMKPPAKRRHRTK